MEFRGQLIKNLLRVLTPEEISELTTSSSDKKKIGLSLLLSSDLRGENYQEVMDNLQASETSRRNHDSESGEAKILPFDEERPEERFVPQAGQRVHLLLQEYGKVFAELDKKVLGSKRFPKRKSHGSRQQTSSLILEQKKKLFESYSKIKSKEVLSLYRTNNEVDLTKKKGSEEDLSFSSKLGVLINKKQA
jgi:hypothetical protein